MVESPYTGGIGQSVVFLFLTILLYMSVQCIFENEKVAVVSSILSIYLNDHRVNDFLGLITYAAMDSDAKHPIVRP